MISFLQQYTCKCILRQFLSRSFNLKRGQRYVLMLNVEVLLVDVGVICIGDIQSNDIVDMLVRMIILCW